MKNTSVTPSATFDQMPRPSHSAKIGASTTRGNALAIFTYGSNTAATSGWRANQKPTATPPSEPMTNARIDSHSVISRCFQITPLENQSTIWLMTSTGLEKKNGGSSTRPKTGTVVNNCHSASATTATSTCRARSVKRDIFKVPSPRRPGEGRDPYAVSYRLGDGAKALSNNKRQGLWVPAFAGTTR